MKLYTLDNKFIKEVFEYGDIPDNFTGTIEYQGGSKHWYVDGKLHRTDGPAVEYNNGGKYWFIDNKEVTELQCKLLCDIMKLKGLV